MEGDSYPMPRYATNELVVLLNPGQKQGAIDRTIDGQWCNKALDS